jgi:hypothetical protein
MVSGGILMADNVISHQSDLQPMIDRALGDTRVDSLVVPIGQGILLYRKLQQIAHNYYSVTRRASSLPVWAGYAGKPTIAPNIRQLKLFVCHYNDFTNFIETKLSNVVIE